MSARLPPTPPGPHSLHPPRPVLFLFLFVIPAADAKSLHEFVLENLPTEHVANLRRRDQADAFLASECRENSEWGVCGVLFTDKYDTSAALKALSFRYRGRVRRALGVTGSRGMG